MPRYRAVPRRTNVSEIRPIRPVANDADVKKPAPVSSTTDDAPELTDAAVAPEASPAKTAGKGKKKS